MKKVFASNFDGTIFFYEAEGDGRLPMRTVEKIREYQAAGNLFGLCTGRPVKGVTPFIEGKIDPDFYITGSGANIVNYHLQEIRKKALDPNVVDVILRHFGTDKYWFTMDVEGEVCVFREMNFKDYPGKYYVLNGVDDAPRGRIHQLSIHARSPEEAAAMVEEINLWYGDSVNAFLNNSHIDIAPRGCHKGEAIHFMHEYISQVYGDVRIYGIGDSMSDLPLLAASDVSYTFPNAPQGLRDRVTKIVPTIVEALQDSMDEDV